MWITARAVFDGEALLEGHAVRVEAGRVAELAPAPAHCDLDLGDEILAPGFVDLQVNGGGGVMFNDDPSPETLGRMAEAHAGLGTLAILPTLITDTPERTKAAIEAVAAAEHPGIAGLHLEGPHLDPARAGAHDPSLIRAMSDADLDQLCRAAERLPKLIVTLAPASVTTDQVSALAAEGVVVSLGHTDADHETCRTYARAGARMATHLFNAMSQLTARAPGLVGAALDEGALSAGLIADGHHVHPATMARALKAKQGPGQVFLVSDAMAVTGSDLDQFTLGGRRIRRAGGRLTLDDGTLAGADLHLGRAVQVLIEQVGTRPEVALAMASSVPANAAGLADGLGRITPGTPARLIRIAPDFSRAERLRV